MSRFIQDLVARFGFGADVDLPSDPTTIGTLQICMLLLHNNQLLTTEEVRQWLHTRYRDLRPVTNPISKDKKHIKQLDTHSDSLHNGPAR
jgi:hypothetical protein